MMVETRADARFGACAPEQRPTESIAPPTCSFTHLLNSCRSQRVSELAHALFTDSTHSVIYPRLTSAPWQSLELRKREPCQRSLRLLCHSAMALHSSSETP